MSAAVVGWLMLACLSAGFLIGACWQSAQGVIRWPVEPVEPVEPWRKELDAALTVHAEPRGGAECRCFACKPLPRVL